MAYLYVFNQFCLSLEESSNPTLDHKLLQPKIDRRERLKSVAGVTKCDKKLLESVTCNTKCGKKSLQSVRCITNCDRY